MFIAIVYLVFRKAHSRTPFSWKYKENFEEKIKKIWTNCSILPSAEVRNTARLRSGMLLCRPGSIPDLNFWDAEYCQVDLAVFRTSNIEVRYIARLTWQHYGPHIFYEFEVRNAAREVRISTNEVRNSANEVRNSASEVLNATRLTWQCSGPHWKFSGPHWRYSRPQTCKTSSYFWGPAIREGEGETDSSIFQDIVKTVKSP